MSNKKVKILFISPRLPYPPIGGFALKNYWLLKILSKYYDIHLVSFPDEPVNDDFYDWANSIGISYKIFKKNKFEFFLNAIKSLFNKFPLQVNYYYFKDVQNYIDSIYEEYDLIYSILIRSAKYVLNLNKAKILDMADSLSYNYFNAKNNTSSLFWKIIYSFEFKRIKKFEDLCINNFNRILLFNKEEIYYLGNINKLKWIPHGVNEELLNYNKVNKNYNNYVIFFGKMNYQPNIDAVMWFIKNVFPYLNKDLKFAILGAFPPKKLIKLSKMYDNLIVTGFLNDPYEIIKSSLCVVAPMQTGGGIQNKVLESMALGTINILTEKCSIPIGAENGKHYIVLDDPIKIAEKINDIYANQKNYEKFKYESRNFIKQNFTWSIYENTIINIIEEVLKNDQSKSST